MQFTSIKCSNEPQTLIMALSVIFVLFTVDNQAPIISSCPSAISRTAQGSGGVNVFWNVPVATDNSGFTQINFQSHVPGTFFSPGTTLVTYVIEDNSQNYAMCQFIVTVLCEYLKIAMF